MTRTEMSYSEMNYLVEKWGPPIQKKTLKEGGTMEHADTEYRSDFLKDIQKVLQSTKAVSGGRAGELMAAVAQFCICQKVCRKHGLMREVVLCN